MHAFLDWYTVFLSSLLTGKKKWFSRSLESPSFPEHIENTRIKMPTISGEGVYEAPADTLVGPLDPAFYVSKWLGPNYPTIIYHHGNNEKPFDFGLASKNTFKWIILSKKDEFPANLIALRAPLHNSGMGHYVKKLGELKNFMALLAASVKLEEELVLLLKRQGCPKIMISGLSLGGWVTNLHRAFFNSAHVYVPVFAGAALGDLFVTSSYRKMASKLAKDNTSTIHELLNYETEYMKVQTKNVYPILARFDQFIVYERQKKCYQDAHIKVLDKGHVTGALASQDIRQHILSLLKA